MNLTTSPGTTVLVIGGSSGVGLAIAQRAHTDGATVAIASGPRNDSKRRGGLIGSRHRGLHRRRIEREQSTRRSSRSGHSTMSARRFPVTVPAAPGVTGLVSGPHRARPQAVRQRLRRACGCALRRRGRIDHHDRRDLVAHRLGRHVVARRRECRGRVAREDLGVGARPNQGQRDRPGIVDTDYWAHLDPEQRREMLQEAASKLPTGRAASAEDIATIAML